MAGLTDKWQKAAAKINLDDRLCSINTKLLCLSTKIHGGKLIHDRTKRQCHKMYESCGHAMAVYLNITRHVQYFFTPSGSMT